MSQKKVIIYSTPVCPYCKKTKSFFNAHNIEFIDYDVSKDREKLIEMKEKSGQLGVPVIDIDGEIIVGYDEEKFKELLNIK